MPPASAVRPRTALVTGASSGLGAAMAAALVAEGMAVWGTSRDPSRLSGSGVRAVRFDLADGPAGAAALVARVDDEAGSLDVLVHAAGYGVFGRWGDGDFAPWQAQLDALVTTTAALAHAAFARWRPRNRGTWVGVSSLAAEFPLPWLAAYSAAKAAQSALAESLMLETRGTGIIVIDFRPGDYRTGFNHAMQRLPSDDPRVRRGWDRAEALLAAAPDPARAATDLVRALRRGRSGVVRSGGLFQARIAPLLARLAPLAWRRAVQAWYCRVS